MTNEQLKSIKLARLWTGLDEVRAKIANELIPFGLHLGLEDPPLMEALETLERRIEQHFERFKLTAGVRKQK